MTFITTVTGIVLLAGLILAWVMQGGFSTKRRRTPGFWKRLFVRQLFLLPVYVFVLVPGILGFVGAKLVRTRGDEVKYEGPVFDARGNWICQDRMTLKSGTPKTPESQTDRDRRRVHFTNPAGRRLRAFFVPCRDGRPTAVAILVHGLFRNAMEVEPVAAMFRDLDVDVLLLELSNHGGSERHEFTFGYLEHEDVLAAVDYVRRRPGGIDAPLILFGVSLGGVAVALAAPKIPELRGLVLDAPIANLLDTAHRQLERFLKFPSFYTSLMLWHLEFWAGFDLADVRPIDSFGDLPPTLPTLFVGAGRDYRVPPEVVRKGFAELRAPLGVKELWIAEESRHGKVWVDQPQRYSERLRDLLRRATQTR